MSEDVDLQADLRRNPYTILLVSMILLLVLWPAIARMELEGTVKSVVHGLLFTVMLVSILYVVRTRHGRRWFLLLLVFALFSDWADHLIDGRETTVLGQAVGAAFLAVVTVFVIRRVFGPGKVTTDRIVAALCAFLFLGMFWANLYALIYEFDRTAFSFPEGQAIHHTDFTYFSFVTLTTLGYGEMSPVHPLARSLAFMEAIFGQLYIAVILARLVALEMLDRRPSE